MTELKNDTQVLTCGSLLIQNSHRELVRVVINIFLKQNKPGKYQNSIFTYGNNRQFY